MYECLLKEKDNRKLLEQSNERHREIFNSVLYFPLKLLFRNDFEFFRLR